MEVTINRLTTPYSVTVSSSLSFHHLKLHILVKGHTEIFKEICMERRRARCTLSEEQGELLEWVCRKKYFWQVSKLAWQWCNNLPQRTNVTKSSVSLGRESVGCENTWIDGQKAVPKSLCCLCCAHSWIYLLCWSALYCFARVRSVVLRVLRFLQYNKS